MRFLFAVALAVPLLAVTPDGGVRAGRTLADVKLLYFHASWCQSCKRFDASGALPAAQAKFPGLAVQSVDADREEGLLQRYGITGIPALVLVDADGFPLGRVRIDLDDTAGTTESLFKLVEKMTRPPRSR